MQPIYPSKDTPGFLNGVLEDWCVLGEVGVGVCGFVPTLLNKPVQTLGGFMNGVPIPIFQISAEGYFS